MVEPKAAKMVEKWEIRSAGWRVVEKETQWAGYSVDLMVWCSVEWRDDWMAEKMG